MKLEAEKYYGPKHFEQQRCKQQYAQRVQTIFGWWGDGETVEVKINGSWQTWNYANEILVDAEYRTKPDEPRVYYLLISDVEESVFRTEYELHKYANSIDIVLRDYEVVEVKEVTK